MIYAKNSKYKYKKMCNKCKKYFWPNELSRIGYCRDCMIVRGKCKAITEKGYQCINDAEFSGYCLHHFLTEPMKDLIKSVKKK